MCLIKLFVKKKSFFCVLKPPPWDAKSLQEWNENSSLIWFLNIWALKKFQQRIILDKRLGALCQFQVESEFFRHFYVYTCHCYQHGYISSPHL